MTTLVGKTLLCGTLDDRNPLSILRGNALVLSKILFEVYEFNEGHIDRETQAWKTINNVPGTPRLAFPEPTGVCINMMPINLFNAQYRNTIPAFLKQYIPLIQQCKIPTHDIHGSDSDRVRNTMYEPVGYLTICEERVMLGASQRRAGLHIDRPGSIRYGGRIITRQSGDPLFNELMWGFGEFNSSGFPTGGIYMASSVQDSCRIFPELIKNPEEVTKADGGIEHLRGHLGSGRCLAANELVWFTDRTPHESLPVTSSDPNATFVFRQFFRLVVGRVSIWYSQHSTANPDGTLPDAPISLDDKFAPQDNNSPH